LEQAGEQVLEQAGEQIAEQALAQTGEQALATGVAEGVGTTVAAEAGVGAMGAMAGAAAIVPYIGAAIAIGSMLGAFKDGGKVPKAPCPPKPPHPPVQDLRKKGGKVKGRWKENKDTHPALLVPGEHVLNAEASKLVGHDSLEALNREGLRLRAEGKTPKEIRRGRWERRKGKR